MNGAIERHGTPRNAPETTVQMWSGKTGWGIWDTGVGVVEVVAAGVEVGDLYTIEKVCYMGNAKKKKYNKKKMDI